MVINGYFLGILCLYLVSCADDVIHEMVPSPHHMGTGNHFQQEKQQFSGVQRIVNLQDSEGSIPNGDRCVGAYD